MTKMFNLFFSAKTGRNGQVMILTSLILGGIILGATTIGGLLMIYQIRQSTNFASSARAISAADAAIENGIYQHFAGISSENKVMLSNGASYTIECYTSSGDSVSCDNSGAVTLVGTGEYGSVKRAFRLTF